MWRSKRKNTLERLAALGGRAGTIALVALGLTPAAPAQTGPERVTVPERIERIRTTLDEHGPEALGTLKTVALTAAQDPEQDPDWDDWDDWSDWNDWADF